MGDPDPVTPVRILGEEYWIRGASSNRIRELAAFVDDRFREFGERGATIDLKRLAVLVSLNIAEEVFAERDQRDQRERSDLGTGERMRALRLRLESVLGE